MEFTVKVDHGTPFNNFRAHRLKRPGRCQMSENSYCQELQGFALELRQLAYTMPPGHEDRLIGLSERMVARSEQSRRRVRSRGA